MKNRLEFPRKKGKPKELTPEQQKAQAEEIMQAIVAHAKGLLPLVARGTELQINFTAAKGNGNGMAGIPDIITIGRPLATQGFDVEVPE